MNWSVPGFVEVRPLGEGGQGRVVLAREQSSGAPVAIKYISAGAGDEQAIGRLREEAVMLARLPHPHIARLYRFVVNGPYAAIVMEAVDGVSLRAILDEHGALSAEAALLVLKGSLLGLAAAHSVGVVHRDYKPANVIVQGDGLSKLIDFGVATLAGVGSRAGTPAYMAPEQWEGEPAVPATDVYAATCVFFECVTGQRPYGEALQARHLLAPVPVERVAEPLRGLIARGMAKQVEQRPPGAAAFVAELEQVASSAYGPDWEQRGTRGLALAAGALAGLFPLAALGIAPAGSGVAAGQGAAAVAGKGLLGSVGAKVTAGVAVTAVVAGGGAVTYNVVKKETPRPIVLSAQVTPLKEDLPGPDIRVDGQYVRVNGYRDAALAQRVNQALRAPMDQRIASVQRAARSLGDRLRQEGDRPLVRTTATVTMRTSKIISVRYAHGLNSKVIWHTTWNGFAAATVSLETGQSFGVRDYFRAGTLGELSRRLRANNRGRALCLDEGGRRRDLRPSDLQEQMVTGLTGAGVQVDLLYVGSTACGINTVTVPYPKIVDLLNPQLAALLPGAATPGPSPS